MEESLRLHFSSLSLFGLSLGDAFGETFFGKEEEIYHRLKTRKIKEGLWEYTDDTVMGIAIFNQLARNKEIRQDELAREFAKNYILDPNRGYGGTAHSILRSISEGKDWRGVSRGVFDGMGSMGNGAAMRAGTIGAYFCDDVHKAVEQARLSAEVTHANEEGVSGAMAVALAANFAASSKNKFEPATFFGFIQSYLPDSEVRAKVRKAASLSPNSDVRTVTAILGNGIQLTAQDTVPFALWCAAHYHHNFEEAIWKAVSGLGDRDTICAIVGSIVILSADKDTIPQTWKEQTENLQDSVFLDRDAANIAFTKAWL